MGHSTINVMTYLRGLKVAELTVEDMPYITQSASIAYG